MKPRASVLDIEPGAGFLLGAAVRLEVELSTLIPKNELCSTNSATDPSEMTGRDRGTTLHG